MSKFQQKTRKKLLYIISFFSDESGVAEIVEATILLPFCLIMVLALYYASIFMCQKANLQANVQNALIYYKNVDSDTFVEAYGDMSYSGDSGIVSGRGSSFGETSYRFPYRIFFMEFDKRKFETFFCSMCGHMFFDDGSNVELTVENKNYVVYKTITVTATQTVKPAVSLKVVGVSDAMTISVTGKAVITNGDDMIRNTDFVIDVVKQTSIGEKATELLDKVSGYYNSFKEKFGVNERG